MNTLTDAEMIELRQLTARHVAARIAKAWDTADALRAELMAWGAWPPEHGWHSWFEEGAHRRARLARRRG